MKNITIGMEVSRETAESISKKLEEELPSNNIQKYEKANSDGTVDTILIMVQTVSSVVSAISPIILFYLQKRSIRKIKIDNVEIENPTSGEVEELLSKNAE